MIFDYINWLFKTGWEFLTAYNIPGVDFTPLEAAFFSSFVVLSIRTLRSLIGHLNPGGAVSALRGISRPPENK